MHNCLYFSSFFFYSIFYVASNIKNLNEDFRINIREREDFNKNRVINKLKVPILVFNNIIKKSDCFIYFRLYLLIINKIYFNF